MILRFQTLFSASPNRQPAFIGRWRPFVAVVLLGVLAGPALPLASAEDGEGVPYMVLHGRAFLDRDDGESVRASATGFLRTGTTLRTEAASAAVFFLESGARISIMSEGLVRFDGEEPHDRGMDLRFFLSEGSLVGALPAERRGVRLRLETRAGELIAEEAEFVSTAFVSSAGTVTQIVGVESGRLDFQPAGTAATDVRRVHRGDSITAARPVDDDQAEVHVGEQLLSGDMRFRLRAGLAQIEEAEIRYEAVGRRTRQTRSPAFLPVPERLPNPSPGAGLPAPRELN